MTKAPIPKQPKPIRYYDYDGNLHTEYLPRVLPEWVENKVSTWLHYKASRGRDWYYYEVRLLSRWPVARKFADLWFLDHIDRDHGPDKPLLWHEKILHWWITWQYRQELYWFNHIDSERGNGRFWQRVRRYGIRYYPIQFNPSMRLIYHGCSQEDYCTALERTRIMLQESEEYWAEDYRKELRRYKRYKRQQAKKKAEKQAVHKKTP
jgi:hypothetical protein